MDIEAIVNKFAGGFLGIDGRSARNILRSALTELAAGYEQKIAESKRKLEVSGYAWSLMGEELNALRGELAESRERIRQLDAGRVPDGWVHSCNALCADGIRLWIDACPHCGMPSAAAQLPKKEGE